MQWPRESRFQITGYTLARSFEDCVALAHMQSKRFHLLNPTATLIWNSIAAGSSIAELENQLSGQFDVDPADLSVSINELLTILNSESFIEIQS